MLTASQKSKARLFAKWMLLPMMLIVFAGFTLRKEQISNGPNATFTVVIDAGHGGARYGATADDGTMEKDLNLLIAKKIKEINKDSRINIVMTRETDEDIPTRERVEKASKMNTGAFISIHVNNNPSGESGIQLMMTKNKTDYSGKSQLLGSLLSQELGKIYKIDGALRVGRTDDPAKGVWVLDAPEINYPSILIECGNLRNENDLEFVKSDANRQKLAEQILNAIKQFANNKTTYVPQPAAIQILVEEGKIDFDLKDDKVANMTFANLSMVSTKNIFPGENYNSDGSEIVLVDGRYLSDRNSPKKHITVKQNQKLIVVSTTARHPLETLVN